MLFFVSWLFFVQQHQGKNQKDVFFYLYLLSGELNANIAMLMYTEICNRHIIFKS